MRPTRVQPAGLFFIEVFSQLLTYLGNRTAHVNVSDQDREIANVRCVFLLEVNVEPIGRHKALSKSWPRPVILSFHLLEHGFPKLISIHLARVSRHTRTRPFPLWGWGH